MIKNIKRRYIISVYALPMSPYASFTNATTSLGLYVKTVFDSDLAHDDTFLMGVQRGWRLLSTKHNSDHFIDSVNLKLHFYISHTVTGILTSNLCHQDLHENNCTVQICFTSAMQRTNQHLRRPFSPHNVNLVFEHEQYL